MEILRYSLLFLTLALCLNALLKFPFDKLTIYNNVEFHWLPTWFILTFMVFGFLMFPFYKIFREYRKVIFMKSVIEDYEWKGKVFNKYGFGYDDKYHRRYISFKRYLKLKKLKRKL